MLQNEHFTMTAATFCNDSGNSSNSQVKARQILASMVGDAEWLSSAATSDKDPNSWASFWIVEVMSKVTSSASYGDWSSQEII